MASENILNSENPQWIANSSLVHNITGNDMNEENCPCTMRFLLLTISKQWLAPFF